MFLGNNENMRLCLCMLDTGRSAQLSTYNGFIKLEEINQTKFFQLKM